MSKQTLPSIGILGGGQLAMMMAHAYRQIGGRVSIFCESSDAPAIRYADDFVLSDTGQLEQLIQFFKSVDVVTLENEFFDSMLLIEAMHESDTRVFPDPHRYQKIEDKLSENLFYKELNIPIADFFVVSQQSDLIDAPGYLKLSKGGYDGIGTYKVNNKEQAINVFNTISESGTVIFERQMHFVKELSLIAVANASDIVFYPMVETHQEGGICRYVSYPSGVDHRIENRAQAMVRKIMLALNTKGLFAFELFLTKDNELFVNESAPRPHNSGHITLDLMNCCQFENHMRAVASLPLKPLTVLKSQAVMVNLLGTRDGDFEQQEVLANIQDKELSIKLYGKRQSRVKRKMGHINLWGNNAWDRAKKLVHNLEI